MTDQPQEKSEQIDNLLLEEEMKESYLTYAMSVITARALPDVRDGLKPSQRRILVAMNDLNLGPRTKHRKCAKIVGDTGGNYHPHGDQATYGTLVRLAQRWNMRYSLVDPQGNFGSIDGDPPAAMRYTEARLSQAAVDMMEDMKQETVDYRPNYDETTYEPVVLPSKFPSLLVNGSTGIAVGMATNIPPHNMTEICDALIKLAEKPDTSLDELCQIVQGPDFPTGGIICGREGILQGYRTGRGIVPVRAKLHTEETRTGRTRIVVDEIPYQLLKTTLIEKIAGCVKSGSIADISDVRDESDRKGMRLVVELKRDANPHVVINQLYQYTPLQSNYSVISIALVNGQPRTLNLKQMLEAYITHRKEVITRRTIFLLRKARQRAHILEGLILAVADIDQIIQLIRSSSDPAAAKQRLMEKPLRLSEQVALRKMLPEKFIARSSGSDQFLTTVQADAILAMQLQRLTGLELEKLATDYAKLAEQIEGYEAILADESLVVDIVREDLYELKEKYGDKRRTKIGPPVGQFNLEDLIPEEEMVVTISHQGYIKRGPIDTYRSQGRGGRGIRGSESKEGDWLEHLFTASTHDYLLVFTSRGRVYWMKVYDVPSMSRISRGRAIVNLLNMRVGEQLTSILAVRRFEERFVIMATRNGIIKKTPLGAFSRPRSSGIVAINLDEGDVLTGAELTGGKDQIVLATREGMAIRFSETNVRAMGRTARGVKGITLRKGDQMVDMAVVDPQATLLTVCQQGYGKRTDLDAYRKQKRGGLGVINIKTSDRNGKVVALKAVHDSDELMLITSNGIVMRFPLKQVRRIGRNTQGVRVIRLDKGDQLVAVARLMPEEENGKGKGQNDQQDQAK